MRSIGGAFSSLTIDFRAGVRLGLMRGLLPCAAAVALSVHPSAVRGQCPEQWFPMGWQLGRPGVVQSVVAWDPDGPGPGEEVLVAAGDFRLAGGMPASNLAVWDGESWSMPLGGFEQPVGGLTVYRGELYIGHAPIAQRTISRWTGASWEPVPDSTGWILGVYNDELIVGQYSGTVAWNGTNWRSLGDPCWASAIGTYQGDLVTASFGGWTGCVSRWDGQSWTPMMNGITGAAQWGAAYSIVEGPGGLYMSGSFSVNNGIGVARWDGEEWQAMGLGWGVPSLHIHDGEVFAGGGSSGGPVGRWNGTEWEAIAAPAATNARVNTLCTFRGDLIAAGQFTMLGGVDSGSIARWDGVQWHALGEGVDLEVDRTTANVLALTADGQDLYVGGFFQTAAGLRCGSVAKWDGQTWDNLAGGVGDGAVYVLVRRGGDVIAGGRFSEAGGRPALNIARWDGAEWSPLGAGLGIDPINSAVWALAEYQGQLYAAGRSLTTASYGLARWDGSQWHPVPTPSQGDVNALAVYNGDLYVGGSIGSVSGGGIGLARWNGSQWLPVGAPGEYIYGRAMIVYNGELIVAINTATFLQGVMRWNGQSWGELGSGVSGRARAFAVAGGELLVGGSFTSASGIAASKVAIWNGSQWRALGSGLQTQESYQEVRAAAAYASGFAVGGEFLRAGGEPSSHLAMWRRGVPECYANCDCSGVSPVLNVADFSCFLQRFGNGDPYANCDQSTEPPVLNVADFSCYLQRFAAGCP
jgi:trimeric autotransporter adhesin